MPLTHPNYKLGKRAPLIDRLNRTFKLSNYLKAVIPAPPGNIDYVTPITHSIGWPMDLNDTLGDCVPAAVAHIIQQWTYLSSGGQAPVILSNNQVLSLYEQVGGYVPGDPSTDQGTSMLAMLRYWKKTGVFGNKPYAYISVNLNDYEEVRQAIWLFGNIFLGIQLPITAQGASLWTVPEGGPVGNGSPGSWGGHCVPICAYHTKHLVAGESPRKMYKVVTWGSELPMTHNFLTTYADEGWVILDSDWILANGNSFSGFNLAALQSDLAAL